MQSLSVPEHNDFSLRALAKVDEVLSSNYNKKSWTRELRFDATTYLGRLSAEGLFLTCVHSTVSETINIPIV